jgi:peroxiredoxin
MKSFAVIIVSFLSILVCRAQQDTYSIKGSVENAKDNAIVLLSYRLDGKTVTDTTKIKDSTFEFSGKLTDPFDAILTLDGTDSSFQQPDHLSFYVEKGEIRLTIQDSIKNAVISNSKLNDEVKEWTEQTQSLQVAMKAINETYNAASNEMKESEEFIATLSKASDSIYAIRKNLALQFIKQHPASFFTLSQLFRIYLGHSPDASEAENLFAMLSPDLKNTELGKNYAKEIENWKKTSIGAIALEFTQNDPDGKPVKLSDFRGKYLLIDFWASWCGPCRKENPNVVEAYNAYKDKNFTILGISLDDGTKKGRENWLKAIEQDGLSWTHVSDLKYWNNEVARLYGIYSIPANFLLDPSGKIIDRNLRGKALMEKLAEYIK